MGNRIKKKIAKRLGCRTYLDYRKKLIQQVIDKRIKELGDDTGQVMVHLVLSRKANYKTIHSLKVFTNCYPVAVKTGNEIENKSVEMEFSAQPVTFTDQLGKLVEDRWKEFMSSIR